MNARKKISSTIEALVERDSLWVNPMLWAGFSAGSVLVIAAMMSGIGLLPDSVGIFIVIFLSLIPVLALVLIFIFYPAYEHVIKRLILLFMALIIIFGSMYFVTILFFRNGQTGELPFEGITDPWIKQTQDVDKLHYDDAVTTYLNSLHFSLRNMTTSEYGDIYPTQWYTKTLSDFQVLLGMGIVVIAVGKHFGGTGQKRGL